MRIELTFPDQSQGTADLKSGTGTSSVTSPITTSLEIAERQLIREKPASIMDYAVRIILEATVIGNCNLFYLFILSLF